MVGTFGALASRSGLVIASTLSCLPSRSGMVSEIGPTMNSRRFATTSCKAGPVPRNVTPVIETPATFSNWRGTTSVTEPEPTLP
jgi:hypothetical protein